MIAVIEGGFTGIELVLELRDWLLAHNADRVSEHARLVSIDPSEVVGPQRPVIADALAAANVEAARRRCAKLGGKPCSLR